MNKTKIKWTDFTWNPITGCWGPGGTADKPNRCSYCYAEKISKRFIARFAQFPHKEGPDPFAPTFHPDRLSQPAKVKKPSKIFVCSMSDLFGDWVPVEWILKVLRAAGLCPQHTFQFLTKNPKRMSKFPFTSNCWVGTTVTNQVDADERLPWLLQVDAPVRFVSHEPLLGGIDMKGWPWPGCQLSKEEHEAQCGGGEWCAANNVEWAIIGAQTGPGAVRPDPAWVMSLADQYRQAGVPLFLKDNLGFKDQLQEFPK